MQLKDRAMALLSLAALMVVIGPAALVEILVTKLGGHSEFDREPIDRTTGRILGSLAFVSLVTLIVAIANGMIALGIASLVAMLSFTMGALLTGHTVEAFLALFGPMILMSALGLKKR